MIIVVGSGNSRQSVTLPHRSIRSKAMQEAISEDAKAFLLRPSTFVGHSKGVK